MADASGNDRRYFPRVKFRAHANLSTAAGRKWPVHILDLSFNGALAALIHKHDLTLGENVVLNIQLDEDAHEVIKMQGRLSHRKEHFLGIECRATGIDNQARLRELLKKNQSEGGGLAERSYASLLKDHESDKH